MKKENPYLWKVETTWFGKRTEHYKRRILHDAVIQGSCETLDALMNNLFQIYPGSVDTYISDVTTAEFEFSKLVNLTNNEHEIIKSQLQYPCIGFTLQLVGPYSEREDTGNAWGTIIPTVYLKGHSQDQSQMS